MVDYQGPKTIRGLVEKANIPFFNRITQLDYRLGNLKELHIEREDVAQLHSLKNISIAKRGGGQFTDVDAQAASDVVPPCRLGSVNKQSKKIHVSVLPGRLLGCCSSE